MVRPKPTDIVIDLMRPRPAAKPYKVVAVGGGGGHIATAVQRLGLSEVSLVHCDTDAHSLSSLALPQRVQLSLSGNSTHGRPDVAQAETRSSLAAIASLFATQPQMVMLLATLGGGTSCGATPVIAQQARQAGLFTIAILTLPFAAEGRSKIDHALDTLEALEDHCDALFVFPNERLRSQQPQLSLTQAFPQLQTELSALVKSLTQLVVPSYVSLSWTELYDCMRQSGLNFICEGCASGTDRVQRAIDNALSRLPFPPTQLYTARSVIVQLRFGNEDLGAEGLKINELSALDTFMASFGENIHAKSCWGIDDSLIDEVKIIILASGFPLQTLEGLPTQLALRAQQQAHRAAQQRLSAAQRRSSYYPTATTQRSHPQPHLFIYANDELDAEELVRLVDESPTLTRSATQLNALRHPAPRNSSS